MAEQSPDAKQNDDTPQATAGRGGGKSTAPGKGEAYINPAIGEDSNERPQRKRPKKPTGRFIALMNLHVSGPLVDKKGRPMKDESGKPVIGRREIAEGSVIPDFVSEEQIATFQDNGVADHEYA